MSKMVKQAMVAASHFRTTLLRFATIIAMLLVGGLTYAATPSGKTATPISVEEAKDLFYSKVEPVFANRCVVCHGCSEAPCNLKLSSYAGIQRGTHPEPLLTVNFGSVLPRRMKDATSISGWRARQFTPVVDDHAESVGIEARRNSILWQALQAKSGGVQFEEAIDGTSDVFSTYWVKDENTCPNSAVAHREMLQKNPYMGMPFGLPKLSEQELSTLTTWIDAGSKGPSVSAQNARLKRNTSVESMRWEQFLNREGAKEKLIARYIYEHTAEARLHFFDRPGAYFELVRSRAPSPQPIDEIVTETHNSDPQTETFFYRLKFFDEAIVKKNNIVWNVPADELDRLQRIFSLQEWNVQSSRMSYSDSPFHDFAEMPERIRAEFMLRHSQLIIDQMVRGTVCIGSTATYAIRDHFFVMFLDPESDPSVKVKGLNMYRFVDKPGRGIRNVGPEIPFDLSYMQAYQKEFIYHLEKMRPDGLGLADLWTGKSGIGDGKPDQNAMLTVLRHENISTVHHGWIGGRERTTSWILSYANFERLYYNLVVHYKYWGSLIHRADTWTMMSEIRKEGEAMFVSLLPVNSRYAVRDQWNQGWQQNKFNSWIEKINLIGKNQIPVTDLKNPYMDLLTQLESHFANVGLGPSTYEFDDSLNRNVVTKSLLPFETEIRQAMLEPKHAWAKHLPGVMVLRVNLGLGRARYYTLIANRWYGGHEDLLREKSSRRPEEDRMSIVPGLIGTHPNLFLNVNQRDVKSFVESMREIDSEVKWQKFRRSYGITRGDQRFWKYLDELHREQKKMDPIGAGLLDLNQYDNGRGKL